MSLLVVAACCQTFAAPAAGSFERWPSAKRMGCVYDPSERCPHERTCGRVRSPGGWKLKVWSRKTSCHFASRTAKKAVDQGKEPRRWSCIASGGEGFCTRHSVGSYSEAIRSKHVRWLVLNPTDKPALP